jgi:hypothetical protein
LRLRQQAGAKGSTINRDLRVLAAALKLARPGFVVPTKTFLPERHTRVRKLEPEQASRPAGIVSSFEDGSPSAGSSASM